MTTLIKRTADNVVLYAGDDLALSPTQASGTGWVDPAVTLSNAVLDFGTPPVTFIGGAYSLDKGVWTLVNQAVVNVPQQISAFQAKAALTAANLFNQVNTYMTTQASAIDALAWAEQATFSRNDAIIANCAGPCGLTSNQLDALFIAGANIQP